MSTETVLFSRSRYSFVQRGLNYEIILSSTKDNCNGATVCYRTGDAKDAADRFKALVHAAEVSDAG